MDFSYFHVKTIGFIFVGKLYSRLFCQPGSFKPVVHFTEQKPKKQYGAKSLTLSRMAEIHVKDYFSSSKAFLIAVSEYSVSSIPSLHSPHNDVNLLKKTLEEQHDFECKTLLNPGKAQLNDFLLSITAEEGDRVILYFAGHGVAADNGSLEGYLLPADANPAEPSTFIAIRELLRTLQRLKCRHFLLILDCCFSGISASGGHQYPGKAITLTETLYFEKFRHYVQHSARHLLVSLSLGNESQGI